MNRIPSYVKYILFFIAINTTNSFWVYSKSDIFEVEIVLQNHKFIPYEVRVPERTKLKLIIDNRDDTVEEFESYTLKREKILQAHKKTNIIFAPLKAGRYEFVGEFHEQTAKGVIIAE